MMREEGPVRQWENRTKQSEVRFESAQLWLTDQSFLDGLVQFQGVT